MRPLDLRVAEVLDASDHPNADRLLVLHVDLGGEKRQLVAGLAGIYEPAELVGKRIVVVANLKPARLRGEESQGMLLAAHGEGRVGVLLAPDAEPGTPLETADPGDRPDGGGDGRAEEGADGADGAEGADGADGGADQITIDDFAAHVIVAAPDGVTLDGRRIERPALAVDREAWGKVK